MKLVPRYTDIADNFAIEDQPSSVAAPQLLLWNASLAKQFNLDVEPQLRASNFAGNEPQSVKAVALGYSGHQLFYALLGNFLHRAKVKMYLYQTLLKHRGLYCRPTEHRVFLNAPTNQ